MSFLRLKKILLFLFLLFIPTQLGKHFWPEWSYVLGIRVDYLSPVLYFLDLIWIGLFFLNWKKPSFSFKYILLALFVVINVLVAQNKGICVYRWLRLFQLIWTVFYLNKNKLLVKSFLVKIIPIWIIFEGVLGLSQIINGGSLGGIFYFLGERRFNFNTIGIAQMSVMGQGLIRAYGTFSHPNSLAGFVLVGMMIMFELRTRKPRPYINIFEWIVVWFGITTLIISGSRLIWTLSLILLLFFIFKTQKNKILIGFSFVLILLMIVAGIKMISGFDKNSFNKRWDLILVSGQMIKERTWTGYGLGNFLVELPNFSKNEYFWLQPVHNVLLLILTESGLLGLGILIFGLFNYLKSKKISKINVLILMIILITGMWDHYWITLPQNWWLMAVVLGVI